MFYKNMQPASIYPVCLTDPAVVTAFLNNYKYVSETHQ